jgi:hypothetical protein
MPRLPAFLLLMVSVTFAPAMRAQVAPGDTVRVQVGPGSDRAEGIVRRLGTTIDLEPLAGGPPRSVPVAAIWSIDRRDGRRGQWLRGAGIGFTAGSLIGDLASRDNDCCSVQSDRAGLIGGLIGIGAGLAVGSMFKTARWRRTPLVAIRPEVIPGVRVRGSASDPGPASFDGVVTRITVDSIVVQGADGATTAAARNRLTRLEWPSRVGRATGRGALIGGLAGAAVVGLLTAASYDDGNWVFSNAGQAGLVGAIVGGGLGVIVGGLAGAVTKQVDWEAAPTGNAPGRVTQVVPIVGPSRFGLLVRVSW